MKYDMKNTKLNPKDKKLKHMHVIICARILPCDNTVTVNEYSIAYRRLQ